MGADILRWDAHLGEKFPIISCGGDEQALAAELGALIGERRALLCTTPTVARHFARLFSLLEAMAPARINLVVFDFSEGGKNLQAVSDIAAAAKAFGIGRRDVLVAIGGGVCSDLVRVAAALIRRGVPHICVPTTLIGQIDAGIGIKGAVNFGGGKSYLGVFHPPAAVLIWPKFLFTLPVPLWREGLAEAIKLACVSSATLFDVIGAVAGRLQGENPEHDAAAVYDTVRECIEITLSELALDPREQGTLERLLDLGHTFSPLIETRSGYRISHGRAVAIDISLSAMIAKCLGLIDAASVDAILRHITSAGLATDCAELDYDLARRAIVETLKHRNGKLNLVVPVALGRCTFVRDAAELSDALLAAALRDLKAWRRPDCAAAAHGKSLGIVNEEPSVLMSMTTSRTV